MNKTTKWCLTAHMKYVGSLALLILLILAKLPKEPETQSHPLIIHSSIKGFTKKPAGKIQAITDQYGTLINEIARNETAYLVGTLYTGEPSYPEPLEVWGHIIGPHIAPSFEQGAVFGKTNTDPDNNHKFVIPLHNGTEESLAFYRSLKGSYQINAYAPGYDISPTNLIVEPPGNWGAPDTLDIYAYSTIGVAIDGIRLSDDPHTVVRGQTFTVQLQARYDDSSWIDASKTDIKMTLQAPFNTEDGTEQTKSVRESIPDPNFNIGVPYDQPEGIYKFFASLDHSTLSSTDDRYLKGNDVAAGITRTAFRVEVLDTKERYSKVDVSASPGFIVNPGTMMWLQLHAWYLDDNSPLMSDEGIEFILKGPFNGTDTDFRLTDMVYNDNYSPSRLYVPIDQPEGKYTFRAILDHEDHSTTLEPLLHGQTSLYRSEKEFKIRVTNDTWIIRIWNPDRDRYLSRDQSLRVDGHVETGIEGEWISVRIGSGDDYVEKKVLTDFNGDFSVTFDAGDLRSIPSGRTARLWAESADYISESRNIIIQSSTTIDIDDFVPDPGYFGQTIHVQGSLKDDQGAYVGTEAVSVQVVDEDITVSGNTVNGFFDIPIVITGGNAPERFRIQARYAGRIPYYTESSTSRTLDVIPLPPPTYNILLQEPAEGVVRFRNGSIVVQGQLQNDSIEGINPLPGVNISVYLGTQDRSSIYIVKQAITNELGDFIVILGLNGSIPVGDFLIWAEAPESGLDPTSETQTVTIRSLTEIRDLTVQPLGSDRAYSGGDVQVNGTLVDDQGRSVSSASITLNWEEELPTTVWTDTSGRFSAILPVPIVTELTTRKIFAQYEWSEYYEPASAESSVEITSHGPTSLEIEVDRTTAYPGEDIVVTGILLDQFEQPLNEGQPQTITITWEGYPDSVSTTTDANGDFTSTIQAPTVEQTGSYILLAEFAQIPGYQEAVANKTIYIFLDATFQNVDLRAAISNETTSRRISLDTGVGVTYEENVNITVKGELVDDLGSPLRNRPLQIILINNATDMEVRNKTTTTDQKGQFSIIFSMNEVGDPGRYRFKLQFSTETNAIFSTDTYTFTILKPPGPNLFVFALVDSFSILGGVVVAYLLHKKGVILSTK